ncbi:MAG: LTA synthase family protein [Atopobiaceae bacterium]|nr:LTA synthase family protein [Atopobiaceae bacterium]
MFSVLAGFIFLIGFFAYLSLTCRHILTQRSLGSEVPKTTRRWNALYGIMLAGFAVLGFVGLIDNRFYVPLAPLVTIPALLAFSHITLRRKQFFDRMCQATPDQRFRTQWGLILLYGLLGIFMIEWPYSMAIGLYGPTHWWLEMTLLLLVTLFFYFVGRRHGSAAAITVVMFGFIGLAQYFIRRFKNAAILPNDLLALGTAAAVSGQYTYTFDPKAITAAIFAAGGLCVLSLLHPCWTLADSRAAGTSDLKDQAKGVVAAALCAFLVLVPNYMTVFQVQMMYWYSINYYENQGFLPTFIAVLQDMPIHKPEDYSTETAEQAERELVALYDDSLGNNPAREAAEAQFAEMKPSVIVVMNESFADLSDLDGLRCGYEGPQFFNSLPDALWRGKLFVSVQGGGTCNSEFEFLTGNSLGYIGAGKYPYSTFSFDNVDSIAKQLNAQGYSSYAIHPNYASNWNRNKVYPELGFGDFLDIDAFGGVPELNFDGTLKSTTPSGVPVFHSGVSDQATYERILETLKNDSTPQFVFDVTMQNHGSYNQNNIPADKLTNYQPTATFDDPTFIETPERLNEYLSCIAESDRALEWLVDELRKLDRPVVLVFFGDHQPSMTPDYNNLWFPGEDDLTHSQRVYHAQYLVWANYDVAGCEQASTECDTSVDVLGTRVRYAIGAPLSTYEKAQLAANEQIAAINLHGYLGIDGTWYNPDEDGPYAELYGKMALVEYLNFAEKV